MMHGMNSKESTCAVARYYSVLDIDLVTPGISMNSRRMNGTEGTSCLKGQRVSVAQIVRLLWYTGSTPSELLPPASCQPCQPTCLLEIGFGTTMNQQRKDWLNTHDRRDCLVGMVVVANNL